MRSKTRCFKKRVLGRRLPNGKPQERLRFRALRSKTLAFKKRIAIILLRFKDFPRGQGLRLGPLRSKNAAFCVCVLKPTKDKKVTLVDVSDIFYFFCSGAGEKEEASEEVASFFRLIQNRGRGGGFQGGGVGGGRALGECLAKYFFSGPKFPPSYQKVTKTEKSDLSPFASPVLQHIDGCLPVGWGSST